MKYGDIRKILEKYTKECRECPYYNFIIRKEDLGDEILPYESCNTGCNTFLARLIKEEITELADREKIN